MGGGGGSGGRGGSLFLDNNWRLFFDHPGVDYNCTDLFTGTGNLLMLV